MKRMDAGKYRPAEVVGLADRTWPERTITRPPAWCSVDLRDGNQALAVPMDLPRKLALFELLKEIGFREIEVAFPSASEVEYRFVRKLIEEDLIPEGVMVGVLTPARDPLIRKTFAALAGVRRGVVHLYNPTSAVQRAVVFRQSRDEVKRIAVRGAELIRELAREAKNPGLGFEYTPESFTGTELDYALEVCQAVLGVWQPTPERKAIVNLPATVETTTPNAYADRIEWFRRNLESPSSVILSVHAHNDRGTAVAATELALLAGAERVEGTLFGNGERTGNADLVTLALNLFSRGIDPGLDFSDLDRVRRVYTACTGMGIHPRHPYAGDLVYTAFSGSHQDAIGKGLKARRASASPFWEVPYLPIDPADVGRRHERIIRITSQSGGGGIGYLLEEESGFRLPRDLRAEFAAAVQRMTEAAGAELAPEEIGRCFEREYLERKGPFAVISSRVETAVGATAVEAVVAETGRVERFRETGDGPLDAFVRGLSRVFGRPISVVSSSGHRLARGPGARTAAYVAIRAAGGETTFGAGVDSSLSAASFRAVLSALNRLP